MPRSAAACFVDPPTDSSVFRIAMRSSPIARGTDETAWSKNRRAEFRVLVDRTAVATIRGSTDE